ncbi:MAG TPA: DUF3857 domain-containing protein, partial [Chthoniobacterales bacterium]
PPPPHSTSTVSPDEIEIPKAEGDALFVAQPATEETRRILAEAGAAPNPLGYPAVLLRAENDLTMDATGATTEEETIRVFLKDTEALDRWASRSFPLDPPMIETKVLAARIILPDATACVLNPKKFSNACGGGVCGLTFPKAQAGSVVELSTIQSTRPAYELPMFYREFFLQEDIPTLSRRITLRLPKDKTYATYLKNAQAAPEASETEFSRVLTWKFGPLAAFEPLPDSQPEREIVAWLGLSSVGSWEEFIRWYRHISEGAFEAGPKVQAKAKEITATYPGRMERIRAAFEFVSALRYRFIELGIGGYRPRTPEQVMENLYGDCKDKANLLIALLRSMGIPADFVLINRLDSTDVAFPGWQFNHAIASVPPGEGQPETLWLDTTDTITPFGYLAPGNFGRDALVFRDSDAVFLKVTSASTGPSRTLQRWALNETEPGRWNGT